MYSRLFVPPQSSYFLFGPRGTGKSTFLKDKYHNSRLIDLLDPHLFQQLKADPSRLSQLVEGSPRTKTWIIDEVQRVPELLPLIHQWMEKDRQLKFILTGSSARKLKQSGTDLLAGRALNCTFHPFLTMELGKDFDEEKALNYGMLPLVWSASEPSLVLKSYLSLYMQLEVQAEGLVRDLTAFSRFLEAISFSQGNLINSAAIARECSIDRKTVQNYVAILEDLLLAFRLPVFAKKAKRELVSHEKFYYFDCGVFRAIRPAGPLDLPEEIMGAVLETLVIQQLRAWAAYSGDDVQLFFWRSRGGVEVDFVVYGKERIWALEVKNAAKVRAEDLRGLREFKADYPMAETFLLHRGKLREKHGDTLCLPLTDFLSCLDPRRGMADLLL